ncbi:hypothetical protein GWK50_17950 [Acidovorax sp. 210-6]|uniref:hypothetical protein n=1 Tax=Acidovorax sp. 210-6 TaxID=2699468 RepID=UPI001389ED0B|nr:hypothetical protein [Acidovorax sp. 210-6]NCU67706.1 hypothetical protein [Acidovorax sp. 210-6]
MAKPNRLGEPMPLPRHKACTAAVEHHAASGFKVVSNGGRVTVEAIGDFFDPKILDAMEYGKTIHRRWSMSNRQEILRQTICAGTLLPDGSHKPISLDYRD